MSPSKHIFNPLIENFASFPETTVNTVPELMRLIHTYPTTQGGGRIDIVEKRLQVSIQSAQDAEAPRDLLKSEPRGIELLQIDNAEEKAATFLHRGLCLQRGHANLIR